MSSASAIQQKQTSAVPIWSYTNELCNHGVVSISSKLWMRRREENVFSLASRSHASELEQPSLNSRTIGREESLLNSIVIIPYNQESEILHSFQRVLTGNWSTLFFSNKYEQHRWFLCYLETLIYKEGQSPNRIKCLSGCIVRLSRPITLQVKSAPQALWACSIYHIQYVGLF